MAESHVHALKIISIAEIVILILAFLAGIISAISLSMVENRTGFCVLYGVHTPCGDEHALRSSAPGACSFSTKISIFATIKAFIYAATRIALLITNRLFTNTRLRLIRFISVPLHGIAAFLILIEACLVTVGRSSLCKSWGECHPGESCSEIVIKDHPESKNFTDTLIISAVVSWINFFLWVIMVFLGISYLVCEHKNKDSDQVAIVADDGERSVVT